MQHLKKRMLRRPIVKNIRFLCTSHCRSKVLFRHEGNQKIRIKKETLLLSFLARNYSSYIFSIAFIWPLCVSLSHGRSCLNNYFENREPNLIFLSKIAIPEFFFMWSAINMDTQKPQLGTDKDTSDVTSGTSFRWWTDSWITSQAEL